MWQHGRSSRRPTVTLFNARTSPFVRRSVQVLWFARAHVLLSRAHRLLTQHGLSVAKESMVGPWKRHSQVWEVSDVRLQMAHEAITAACRWHWLPLHCMPRAL